MRIDIPSILVISNPISYSRKVNNIKDLNLEKDLLQLFDYTYSDFSKAKLLSLLLTPLSSIDEILIRQKVIKGLLENYEILKDYSYPRIDYHEVYNFLEDSIFHTYVINLEKKLYIFKKERRKISARFVQFVLLFDRLHTSFFKRMKIDNFPAEFKADIIQLDNFIANFDLAYFNILIRKDKFTIRHVIKLAKLISEKKLSGDVFKFYKNLFTFEALLSLSLCIHRNEFCFPTFSDKGIFIQKLYHPLIKNPVPSGFDTTNNVVLLTGPNMSGKSTFLRSVGMCVYLAHIGIGVPATKAEIPFFDYISISIDHNDDMLNGYSHFMGEIMCLKQVLENVSKGLKCFAVFDELFKGTNIEDAFAISSMTIQGLKNFQDSFFLISTHLHQLKELKQIKANEVDTYYIDCYIKDGIPVFNYQIKSGWSDLKVGQILFEKEGLKKLLSNKIPGQ